MLKIKDCEENNLCVDCKNEECLLHGKAMSDCPKYDCDNKKMYDCDNCASLKAHQEQGRLYYKQKRDNEKLLALYNNNEDFRQYVDRYCKTYNLSIEEALKHVIVGEVAKEYAEEKK